MDTEMKSIIFEAKPERVVGMSADKGWFYDETGFALMVERAGVCYAGS